MSKTKEVFHAIAAHHTAMAKECHKAAEHEDTPACLKPTFKAMAIHHENAAEHVLNHCKATDDDLDKATGNSREEFLEQLVLKLAGGGGIPAGLSLVPRHGAPSAPGTADVRKSLDPALKNVIAPEEQEPVAASVVRSGRTQF